MGGVKAIILRGVGEVINVVCVSKDQRSVRCVGPGVGVY